MRPLENEFGWTRAEISLGALIPSLAAVIVAPLVGIAIDRYGPRRIALLGVPFFCVALAALATAGANIVSWWVLYGLVGISCMFILPTVWTAAINARFDRNRGLALGVTLSGTGISAAVFPIVATRLLEMQGWRFAYLAIAALCFLVVFPLVFFLLDRNVRFSGRAHVVRGSARTSLRTKFTSAAYLKLAGAALMFSAATCALTVNAVPILLAQGFNAMAAAGIAGLVGFGSITGRLSAGFLLDRFDARFVAAGSGIAPFLGACVLLALHHSHWGAMAACLAFGIAGGTEYDACAYLTARHFGMRSFGSLFGLIGGLSLLGAGLAPVLANHIYDVTKSYDAVFWAVLPAFAVAFLLFILLGPYPLNGSHFPDVQSIAVDVDTRYGGRL